MGKFVIVQEVWVQVTADYSSAKRNRTLVVEPETTIEQVMQWAEKGNLLGRGDVTITVTDDA
jgi:hypothetical protein